MNLASSDLNIALLQKNKFNDLKLNDINNNKKLREATDNFESFFIQQMLDISLKNINIAGHGTGNEILKGLYTENFSKVSAGTLGISNLLYEFLSENKKGKKS